jgi:hypothetical protein
VDGNATSTIDGPSNEPSANDNWASDPPACKDLTITYCAVVKSGERTSYIPIDEGNILGPEKFLINAGMKTIWK